MQKKLYAAYCSNLPSNEDIKSTTSLTFDVTSIPIINQDPIDGSLIVDKYYFLSRDYSSKCIPINLLDVPLALTNGEVMYSLHKGTCVEWALRKMSNMREYVNALSKCLDASIIVVCDD